MKPLCFHLSAVTALSSKSTRNCNSAAPGLGRGSWPPEPQATRAAASREVAAAWVKQGPGPVNCRSLLLPVIQPLQSLAQVSDAGLEVERPPDGQTFLVE